MTILIILMLFSKHARGHRVGDPYPIYLYLVQVFKKKIFGTACGPVGTRFLRFYGPDFQ